MPTSGDGHEQKENTDTTEIVKACTHAHSNTHYLVGNGQGIGHRRAGLAGGNLLANLEQLLY